MSRLEMQTKVGWARTHAGSGHQQEKEALAGIRDALRLQAERHLQDSAQPAANTAQALELLLRPVLSSAGMKDPKIQVQIADLEDLEILDPAG
jgi:hypothetical protein